MVLFCWYWYFVNLGECRLLIGCDVLYVFEFKEVRVSCNGGLYVIRIIFGWVVNGLLGWVRSLYFWIVNFVNVDL